MFCVLPFVVKHVAFLVNEIKGLVLLDVADSEHWIHLLIDLYALIRILAISQPFGVLWCKLTTKHLDHLRFCHRVKLVNVDLPLQDLALEFNELPFRKLSACRQVVHLVSLKRMGPVSLRVRMLVVQSTCTELVDSIDLRLLQSSLILTRNSLHHLRGLRHDSVLINYLRHYWSSLGIELSIHIGIEFKIIYKVVLLRQVLSIIHLLKIQLETWVASWKSTIDIHVSLQSIFLELEGNEVLLQGASDNCLSRVVVVQT